MLRFFSKKPQRVVGVDITGDSIKIIELSHSRGTFQLEAYAIQTVATLPVHDLTGITSKSVTQALRRLLDKTGVQACYAAMSMPDAQVICKTVEVEAGLSESDLEVHIRLEAEQYVPYALDQAALDFQVLGPSTRDSQSVEVLLAVCRQQALEWYQAVLVGAGLQPRVIEVQAHALAHGVEWLSTTPDYQANAPFAGVQLNPQLAPEAVFCDAPLLLAACGLALRGFD